MLSRSSCCHDLQVRYRQHMHAVPLPDKLAYKQILVYVHVLGLYGHGCAAFRYPSAPTVLGGMYSTATCRHQQAGL